MKYLYIFLIYAVQAFTIFGQNPIADSLLNIINIEQDDSLRQVVRIRYAQSVKYKIELAKPVLEKGLEEMKTAHNFYFLGELNHTIGIMFANGGQPFDAIDHFKTSLNYRIFLRDTFGMASSFLALSNVYRNIGDYDKAVDNALESEKIYLNKKDHSGLGKVYNSLGLIFRELKDSKKAIHYFNVGLEECELAGDYKVIAGLYENLGGVYQDLNNLDSALYFHRKSNNILKNDNVSPIILGASYGNLGLVYMKSKELDSAKYYLENALNIFEQFGYKEGIIEAYTALGELYGQKGNYSKSLEFYKAGEKYSIEANRTPLLVDIFFGLGQSYQQTGNFKRSAEYYSDYIKLRDSLYSYEQSAEVQKREIAVQFEKKQFADSLRNLEKSRIEDLENQKRTQLENERQSRQNQFMILTGIALIITLIFSFFLLKNNRKQKFLNEIIGQQKSKVEEKNREITDSINYAKRIQEAILPSYKMIEKYFPDSFVFYQPKDIVAGDFYWVEERENLFFIAAADCTGHGVPGAMVSVVCANALNRTVKEFNLTDPGEILDKVRELVIATFEKSSHDVKDGMDISLCVIDKLTLELKWSGANNPLWIFREKKNSSEFDLLDFTPNRQPVGKYDRQVPFTSHKFNLMKNDRLYMFTDGYPDQFGGINGKKFKTKQLKEFIRNNLFESMNSQLFMLSDKFKEWKSNFEQTDDVCVIGFKI